MKGSCTAMAALPMVQLVATALGPYAPQGASVRPRLELTLDTRVGGDGRKQDIASMTTTTHGRLVMADKANRKLKMADPATWDQAHLVSHLELDRKPESLVTLRDGTLAALMDSLYIYLFRVSGDVITVTSKLGKRVGGLGHFYNSLAAGLDDNTLVACRNDPLDEAVKLEVVSRRDGRVVREVASIRHGLPHVGTTSMPDFLCWLGGDLVLSDWAADHHLHRVSFSTGQVSRVPYPDRLIWMSYQLASDRTGNLYVTSRHAGSVLMMSPDGLWLVLVQEADWAAGHSEPVALSVSEEYLYVAWRHYDTESTVVKAYRRPAPPVNKLTGTRPVG